jgi:hypothetical protein
MSKRGTIYTFDLISPGFRRYIAPATFAPRAKRAVKVHGWVPMPRGLPRFKEIAMFFRKKKTLMGMSRTCG